MSLKRPEKVHIEYDSHLCIYLQNMSVPRTPTFNICWTDFHSVCPLCSIDVLCPDKLVA